jgi:DNA-binding transcriptional ArsR family regulator
VSPSTAALLRALADEARLEIVARLAAAGRPVCERRGSWVYYSLDFSIVGRLAELIGAFAPPSTAERVAATVTREAS